MAEFKTLHQGFPLVAAGRLSGQYPDNKGTADKLGCGIGAQRHGQLCTGY